MVAVRKWLSMPMTILPRILLSWGSIIVMDRADDKIGDNQFEQVKV